jgi:hypothetical protein
MAPDPTSIPSSTATQAPVPARRSIEYSAQGAKIAGEFYEKADEAKTADEANDILWKGYSTLIRNNAVTEDEKALARYGDKLAQVTLDPQEHNRIAFQVLDCLAHPVAGPLGPALAQTFIKVADNVKLAEPEAHVLWKGFGAIIKNSATTDDEKAVAKLGDSIAQESLDWTEHDLAAYPLMQAISNSVTGPIGTTLAKLAYESADNVKLAESAAHILWKGFDAIIKNSAPTADEKAVARLGDAIAQASMDWTEHDLAAFPVMQAISNSITGPIGTTLAKVAYSAADNVKNAESANEALEKGFTAILKNSGSTTEEKAVAELAVTLSQVTLEETEHNRIAFPLMEALEKGVQGPTGPLLAQVAYRAADNVGYAETADKVIWSAYDAIGKDPQLSEGHRAILELGEEISHHTFDWVEHNHLGFPILEALRKPVSGSIPHMLAAISYKSAHNCGDHNAESAALQEGFKAILARDDATKLERDLAKIGCDIDNCTSLPAEKAAALRFFVMEHIVKESERILPAAGASQSHIKSIGELKNRVKSLEKKIKDSKSAVADLEQKNKADSAAYDSLDEVYEKLDKKTKILTKVSGFVTIGAIGSFVAALAISQPLLFIPAGLALCASQVKKHIQAKRSGCVEQLNGINSAMEGRNVEIQVQNIQAKIHEQKIVALKPQIELLESAEALNRPTAEVTSTDFDDDDDSFIVIDGIKLEKHKEPDPAGNKLNPQEGKGHA